MGNSGGSVVKNLPANVGDVGDAGSTPGLGKIPGGGNGNQLQYFCLGNSMEKGAWKLQSMGSQRVRHNLVAERTHTYIQIYIDSNTANCAFIYKTYCVKILVTEIDFIKVLHLS